MRLMRPTLANTVPNLKRRDVPRLWLMSDPKRLPDPTQALSTLPRGAALIVRHSDPKIRRALARKFAPLCRRRGIACLIAGDWRLAAAVGADGVHLSDRGAQHGLAPGARLWLKHGKRLLTVAAHGRRALERAAQLGATAAILAPVFRTTSHPKRKPLGPPCTAALFRSIRRHVRIPVIALGGITRAKMNALRGTGVHGVAGIGFALGSG